MNFISKGYAGRASDEYIPEDNENLIKLQAGNVMLANWGGGFYVEDSVAY